MSSVKTAAGSERKSGFSTSFAQELRNSIRVDEDIIKYTGATLSSKAVARGVKRALFLLDTFYPGKLATNWLLQANSRSNFPCPPSDYGFRKGIWPCTAKAGMPWEAFARFVFGAIRRRGARAFATGFAEIRRIERVAAAYATTATRLGEIGMQEAGPVQVSESF